MVSKWVAAESAGARLTALRHSHHGQRQPVAQRHLVALCRGVTEPRVERFARERRHQLNARKSRFADRFFAGEKERSPHATARPVRMNEERAHARGIPQWIEFWISLRAHRITAEKRPALAPASAANDVPVAFDDVVGLIDNELSIDTEHRAKRRFHLRGRVIRRLQRPHRERNQPLQFGHIALKCKTMCPVHERAELEPVEVQIDIGTAPCLFELPRNLLRVRFLALRAQTLAQPE